MIAAPDSFSRALDPIDAAMTELRKRTDGVTVDQPATQAAPSRKVTFREALTQLLNQYSKENSSNTPDYLLANFLIGCMDVFDLTVRRRDEWFGRENKISTTGKL